MYMYIHIELQCHAAEGACGVVRPRMLWPHGAAGQKAASKAPKQQSYMEAKAHACRRDRVH